MTAGDELIVLMHGVTAASLRRDRRGDLALLYDDNYMTDAQATPLSLSLPFGARPHGHHAAQRWISSLLPDNPDTLSRWYTRHKVSSPFGLLGTGIGHDCAGAVQFCRPGKEAQLTERAGGVTMLTDEQMASEIERTVAEPSRWIDDSIEPYYSLAGYQTKVALHRVGDRWARPHGNVPTTHILKPGSAGVGSAAVVEHLCAAAARRAGLNAVATHVEVHASHPVLVVERYDRAPTGSGWVRRHQEDMCQALGVDGNRKYENEGGPGIAAIADAIRNYSSDPDGDVRRLADGLLWALILVNRDAHARNYSLLLAGTEVRFAPLYDLQSSLPYVARGIGDRDMAMRYGTEFSVYSAGSDHALLDVAARLGVPAPWLLDRAEQLASHVVSAVSQETDALPAELQNLADIEGFQRRLSRRVSEIDRTIGANRRRLSPARGSPAL